MGLQYSNLPLRSSAQVIRALRRLGCYQVPKANGSHSLYKRDLPDGRTVMTVVIVGRQEVPKGTLRRILQELEITADEFRRALR